MADEDFDDLPWHDAVLLGVEIDRRLTHHPDEMDAVCIDVSWPNKVTSRITFRDCYRLITNMNFGYLNDDSILTAHEVRDSGLVRSTREGWGRMGMELEGLRHFFIEMNTTASKIDVVCRGFFLDRPAGM